MSYLNKTLVFDSNKIYYYDENGEELQVMMSWEDNIMKASADYVCENGGDILEIGFGMGIAASYIQANSITSHTIVEIHPQIIEKAKAWAQDKPNITIIEGDWYEVKDSLSTYDGVFYDAWADDNVNNFTTVLPTLMKSGGKSTWWNGRTDSNDIKYMNGTVYETISVNPVDNMYFMADTYYLPKKQF
jgi:protein arginine N-methyltransferase 2